MILSNQTQRLVSTQTSPPTKTSQMKKFITVVLLSLAASIAITSCTEEEVTPSEYNGGGQGYDPKTKP